MNTFSDPSPADSMVYELPHHAFSERWWPSVEREISEALRWGGEASPLERMTAYQLSTGGKRLRALMPLRVAELLGVEPERVLPFAAACELLHNASLVLDDIQDGDVMRRDRETVWRHFGLPQGINLGVALMFYAPLLVQRLDVSAQVRERLQQVMVETTLQVIRGQSLEIELRRGTAVSWPQYVEIAEAKTGGFLALPLAGAALLSEAPDGTAAAFFELSRHLGVLFQVQDDVMDLWGEKGRGQCGNDIREGKPSALVAFACERVPEEGVERLEGILARTREVTSMDDVTETIRLFEECGARDRALEEILERSQAALSIFDDAALQDFVMGLVALMTQPIRPLFDSSQAGRLEGGLSGVTIEAGRIDPNPEVPLP